MIRSIEWKNYPNAKGTIQVYGESYSVDVEINNENKTAAICIEDREFGNPGYSNKEIPEKVNISDSDPLFGPKPGDYEITGVYLKCDEWSIRLPKTVQWVAFKEGERKGGLFFVDENNPNLFSDNGSLYSKEGVLIYQAITRHTKIGDTIILRDDTKYIMPGAIYKDRYTSLKLVLPGTCDKLVKGAIVGSFTMIDFKGGIRSIEADALNDIVCNDIRINGLLSEIDAEGQKELCRWYNRRDYRNPRHIYFAKPEAKGSQVLDDGYIQLTKVLSPAERLERTLIKANDCDSCPVSINAYINERFSTNENVALPIVINTIPLFEKDYHGKSYYFYEPTEVTSIKFVAIGGDSRNEANYYEILVYESEERIRELIRDSFMKLK